jgi:hypothetical protein
MSTFFELESLWPRDRFCLNDYPEFLEPKDLYQFQAMSNSDGLTMYDVPTVPWDWKSAELLAAFSRPAQLSSSVDDDYEILDRMGTQSYLPYTVDMSRIAPTSDRDSEETPPAAEPPAPQQPAPEPPSRKATLCNKGNNPFGSRGCESCAPCRRRKGRVWSSIQDWLMVIVRIHFERSSL